MKQNKKWMLVAIALLALVTVALPLVGCKHDADEAHTHSFDETKWKSDATGHWHECSCGEKQEGSFATHSYGDWEGDANTYKVTEKCTVCGQSREIPDFVYVKGGEIEGAALPWEPTEDREKGVFVAGRTVKLSDFFIGKYEVTQEEYASVMANQKVKVNETEHTLNANPSKFTSDPATDENQGKRPVEQVSWYDAVYFCNELTKKTMSEDDCVYTITVITVTNGSIISATVEADFTQKGYRLPTEAEWEYAARGGKQEGSDTLNNDKYAGTNEEDKLEEYAWYYDENSEEKTHEVGKKTANSLGIYDMSGNVWEWCWDWSGDITAEESPVTNPTGPDEGSNRVVRGGGWGNVASDCRVSFRYGSYPDDRFYGLGFRVVRPSSK